MTVSIRKAALSALLPVLLGLAPLAAHAATVTFTGQNPTGTDPLGGVYQIGAFGGGITNFEEVRPAARPDERRAVHPGQRLGERHLVHAHHHGRQ